MQGVGNSHLEISTEQVDAQLYFDQGVALLHDFWWLEAYRAFLQYLRALPQGGYNLLGPLPGRRIDGQSH